MKCCVVNASSIWFVKLLAANMENVKKVEIVEKEDVLVSVLMLSVGFCVIVNGFLVRLNR